MSARETQRYLGLELSGAKNPKTALSVLEFYPKERKLFLLDIHEKIARGEGQTPDEALIELIEEERTERASLGVNVPLTLPPCIGCTRKTCPMPAKCSVASVRATVARMRKIAGAEVDFTPYTQRPIELWVRHELFPSLPKAFRFDLDETLGGSKAPLTARMDFLKRHLQGLELYEVWPKLSVALLGQDLKLNRRLVTSYRNLEEGAHSREEILEAIVDGFDVFIYDRDARKLALSLAAFDSFICAFTAFLAGTGRTEKPPAGFPVASGWVHFPSIQLEDFER